jgi:hypothetical protein
LQRVFSKIDLSKETILISLLWAFFALAIPTKIGNFDFRHFVDEEGLTLSVSRSAPPMAILEDERLTNVPMEPLQEIKRTKGSSIIVAGQSSAWPRLKYYSRIFEKRMRLKALNQIAKKTNHSISKMSDVINLVKFFPSDDQKIPKVYAVSFTNPARKNSGRSVKNVREDVERPLVAPSVPRSLPTGEDAPPSKNYVAPAMVAVTVRPALEADPSVEPKKIVTPAIVPVAAEGYVLSSKRNNSANVASAAHAAPPVSQGPLAAPPIPPAQKVAFQPPVAPPGNGDTVITDRKPAAAPLSEDLYKISGQIELSGGLVATGSSTKVDIQWHSGSQTRVGVIDYSTGQFLVEVPSLNAGKIAARLLDETGSVLGTGEYELEGQNDPTLHMSLQSVQGVTILIEPEDVEIRGQVVSAYNVGQVIVPILGAEVFGPNQVQDVAEKNGTYNLTGLGPSSNFVLEAYAQEHWGTRIFSSAKRQMHIPVFANKMMDSFFSLVGVQQDGADYGVVWGVVKRKGNPISGVQVKLVGTENIQPVYFNELRIPDLHLRATSTNGLYAFTKIKPGINIVNAKLGAQELPSTVVSVSASRVSYSEISFKSLNVEGSVFDPVANSKIDSSVSVVGASNSAVSGGQGFNFKVPSSDSVVIVEAQPSDEYYKSRAVISRPEAKGLQINAFRKDWLKEKLRKVNVTLKDSDSVLIGTVKGPGYHAQLDDPIDPGTTLEKAEPQVFYFNEKGDLDPTLLDAGQNGGSFVMVNLKPGLHTLIIQSDSGESSTARLFASDPGVASVVSLTLSR